MPRRKLETTVASQILQLLTGLTPMAAQGALTVASHAHNQRSGHLDHLGRSHLVNYNEQVKRRKPKRRYPRKHPSVSVVKGGIPQNLSVGGGKLSTRTFFNRKKILSKSKAMPYRPKRPLFGRRYKKRRGARRRRLSIPLGISRSKLVRFRAIISNSLTGSGGAIGMVPIKANSLNDPSGTVAAVLPLSLDQWAAFYQKYTVLGSRIVVRVSHTANSGPLVVGLHLAQNATALTSWPHYKELPMTKTKMLSTQKDGCILTMNYSGKRFWHVPSLMSDSEQEATLSTSPGDPTDIAYFHLFVQDMNAASNATIDYAIEIDYICKLNEPINLDRSSL